MFSLSKLIFLDLRKYYSLIKVKVFFFTIILKIHKIVMQDERDVKEGKYPLLRDFVNLQEKIIIDILIKINITYRS